MNEVALGKCKDFYEYDKTLREPPSGFNSTHGVRNTDKEISQFKDDEFVVYDSAQQRIR